jgi:hypothetical protein
MPARLPQPRSKLKKREAPTMKKVSYWAFHANGPVFVGSGREAEMFGQLCRLQSHSFFSIGHSFAALAFCCFSFQKAF